MNIANLKDADCQNKTVVLRTDFNVPINENCKIEDDTRIKATLPTIRYLLEQNAKIIIISHLGRPKGEIVEKMRLTPVAQRLGKLLDKDVKKLDLCVGEKVQKTVQNMQSGDIIMLENLRFYPGEKKNDPAFAKELANLGDIYVNDAFATSHRAHASMVGIPTLIPGYAGFLVQKEVEALSKGFHNPRHPITLILGGAKVDTKIGIIENFIGKADHLLFGGALATTFLAARGFFVADSLYEEDKLNIAREIMLTAEKQGCQIDLPHDVVVVSDISPTAEKLDLPIEDIEGDMKIVDIGQVTAQRYQEIIKQSQTIVWNGPVGIHEIDIFAQGSKKLAEAIIKGASTSIIGGGDTIDFLERYNFNFDKFTHVSTAGGAMVEFLEGKELPGLQILQK